VQHPHRKSCGFRPNCACGVHCQYVIFSFLFFSFMASHDHIKTKKKKKTCFIIQEPWNLPKRSHDFQAMFGSYGQRQTYFGLRFLSFTFTSFIVFKWRSACLIKGDKIEKCLGCVFIVGYVRDEPLDATNLVNRYCTPSRRTRGREPDTNATPVSGHWILFEWVH
jgi:hypothetical protein